MAIKGMKKPCVVVAEGLFPDNRGDASYVGNLGMAQAGQGMIAKFLEKKGWEELVRSGLLYLRKANELD